MAEKKATPLTAEEKSAKRVARALKLRAEVNLKTLQAQAIIAGFNADETKSFTDGKTAQDTGTL